MSCKNEYKEIDINELSEQLKESKKALVDRAYVDYESEHLFDYDIDFNRFLNDINHIIEAIKSE